MTFGLTVQAHSACAVVRGEAELVQTTQTTKTAHGATPIYCNTAYTVNRTYIFLIWTACNGSA